MRLFLLIFVLLPLFSLSQQKSELNGCSIIFVRHAEKESQSKDPQLSIEGLDRAGKLATLLSNQKINAVFSTNFKRTIETVTPTANSQYLEIEFYDPLDKAKIESWVLQNPGKTLLVVGHSNTIPALVNHFAQLELPDLEENEYDKIFIVSILDGRSKLLTFTY